MIRSPRKFRVQNPGNPDEARSAFTRHIVARTKVVTAARSFRAAFPNSEAGVKGNTEFWKVNNGSIILKEGATGNLAVADVWKNPQLYSVGCQMATHLVVWKALGYKIGLHVDTTSDEWKDWVPGDQGYIENTTWDEKTYGAAGENLIYLGNNKWWGHAPKDYPPSNSLDGWMKVVEEWGTPKLLKARNYPPDGLYV